MRFSEAVLLGSTAIGLDPSIWYVEDHKCSCLIGQGFYALGNRKTIYEDDILNRFPWMRNLVDYDGAKLPAISAISAEARKVHKGIHTLEQAIDFIRSVEPADSPESVTNPQETSTEKVTA